MFVDEMGNTVARIGIDYYSRLLSPTDNSQNGENSRALKIILNFAHMHTATYKIPQGFQRDPLCRKKHLRNCQDRFDRSRSHNAKNRNN